VSNKHAEGGAKRRDREAQKSKKLVGRWGVQRDYE